MKGSWKTTSAGLGMIIAVLVHVINDILATRTITLGTTEMATLLGGIGLIVARDNNVSSEQAGIVKPTEQTKPQ